MPESRAFISVGEFTLSLLPHSARAAVMRSLDSPLRRRLAQGLFWSTAGAIVGRVLAVVSTVLTARLIGREHYGALGIIVSTLGMIQAFAGFGLGITATKHVAQFRTLEKVRAGRIIALSSLLAAITGGACALLLLCFAPWLASYTLAAPQLAPLLRISALIVLFASLNAAQNGAMMGLEAFQRIAQMNVLAGILSCLLCVGGAWLWGLNGAVWAAAIQQVFTWLLFHVVLRREALRDGISLSMHGCFREARLLWSFSVPATVGAIMVAPVNWACGAIIIHGSGGYAAMGVYNAASQWLGAILFIPGTLAQAIVPILSDRVAHNDSARSRKILFLSIKLNAVLVMPLVIIGCIASPYVMSIYGRGFAQGWPTLVLVLLTAGVLAVEMPVGDMIVSCGRMWTGFLMNVSWAAIFVVGTIILMRWGASGLAGARLVAYAAHAIWTIWVARQLSARMTTNGKLPSERSN